VTYLALLIGCIVVTLPLELFLHTRVYARPRRLALTLLPVLVVFLMWDALAVHAGQWHYRRVLGLSVLGLPVEELLFFVVVPTCSILAFEAVRRRRPHWPVDGGGR
jgi:lycopene cyclase domain-containing protein